MVKLWTCAVVCLLCLSGMAGAIESVENPESCDICGMDRTVYARSRMLVNFTDGTSAGACSIHCAAEEIRLNSSKQVASLLVADYNSLKLIDAQRAHWVIGGNVDGVMTSRPKWAFATENDAAGFITEHGGVMATFDEAMKAAREELEHESGGRHDHDHAHAMGPGSQLLYNPAFGDDIYHTHPAGMWMASYKYMHTGMSGLRAGTSPASASQAGGYMMLPAKMSMDMHMLMIMYGVTDRLTFMGMTNFLENTMDMSMNMGMGPSSASTMRTSGLGDAELRGIYKLTDSLVGSLGVGIPTGNITQEITTMGMTFRAPYSMQLGSGTVDLKPALTYNALSDDAAWNWGAQASYTNHVGRNDAGYSLGDNVKLTSWVQRALGPASAWLRFAYNNTWRISGRDREIQKLLDPMNGAPTPDADPNNYGGQRIDGFVGASCVLGPVSLGVEGGMPLYQNVNGVQLANDWYLTVGIHGMF